MDLREVVYGFEEMGNLSHGCGFYDWLSHGSRNDARKKYLLFDVRTLEEYEVGHLSGAVLIPYDTIRERIHAVAPDKSMQIYLYCRSGGRAAMAKQILEEMGYNYVDNLGGISSASRKIQLQIIK
jgi:phage shock protein E